MWLKIIANKWEILLVLGLLAIAGIAHGWNMFHYPYYENDEATYVSQAWSTYTQGKLAPYTYYYDHAPMGWILLGLWLVPINAMHIFSSLIDSGRAFMLLLHLLSALLVYLIAKKITNSVTASTLAVLLFSLTPLGIYFQRRILLDNIMIFWVLLSSWLLLLNRQRLRYIIASAVCFGIAILTKENAIFFGPPLLYILYVRSHSRHKSFALIQWLAVVALIILVYILYALLKGELFKSGTLLGGHTSHVSLIDTYIQQSKRGTFHWPWQENSDFYLNMSEWLNKDPLLIGFGVVATISTVVLSIWQKSLRFLALMTVFFWLFLARGRLTINFYILPLLPLLAISISSIINILVRSVNNKLGKPLLWIGVILSVFFTYSLLDTRQYTNDETSNQLLAVRWINQNIPKSDGIAIDNYAYPYLHDQGVNYSKADYFFKVELNPYFNDHFGSDWRNINYILLTHETVKQMKIGAIPNVKKALEHSTKVADFTKGTTSYIDLDNYVSTNGDWAQIYKVDSRGQILLQDSWEKYKSTFIQSYGQIVDNNVTTSEGQAYAMLRSVKENDRNTFDGVYSWTKDHMQHRPDDKLFSWKWQLINGKWQQVDSNTATDADQDIAYALVEAYSTWHDQQYLADAKHIISDIWSKEVVQNNGVSYLMPSAAGRLSNGSLLYNPSYVSTSYYKAFAQIDSSHPWPQLTEDSYRLLNSIQNKTTGLFPDWIEFDQNGNQVPISVPSLSNASGYDAFRTGYRLSQDSTDPRAQNLLTPLSNFYLSEWKSRKMINAVYSVSGTPAVPYGDLAQYSAILNVLKVTGQSQTAQDIYTKQIEAKYKTGFWGDSKNYYNQNWVWLGISTYGEGLKIK